MYTHQKGSFCKVEREFSQEPVMLAHGLKHPASITLRKKKLLTWEAQLFGMGNHDPKVNPFC
jgi:hypothetical protein